MDRKSLVYRASQLRALSAKCFFLVNFFIGFQTYTQNRETCIQTREIEDLKNMHKHNSFGAAHAHSVPQFRAKWGTLCK